MTWGDLQGWWCTTMRLNTETNLLLLHLINWTQIYMFYFIYMRLCLRFVSVLKIKLLIQLDVLSLSNLFSQCQLKGNSAIFAH